MVLAQSKDNFWFVTYNQDVLADSYGHPRRHSGRISRNAINDYVAALVAGDNHVINMLLDDWEMIGRLGKQALHSNQWIMNFDKSAIAEMHTDIMQLMVDDQDQTGKPFKVIDGRCVGIVEQAKIAFNSFVKQQYARDTKLHDGEFEWPDRIMFSAHNNLQIQFCWTTAPADLVAKFINCQNNAQGAPV